MNDEILDYLKQILDTQKEMQVSLDNLRAEITGQFQMMLGNTQRVDGLERIASAHHDRLTTLERKS